MASGAGVLSKVDRILTPVPVVDGEGLQRCEGRGVGGVGHNADFETAVAARTVSPEAESQSLEVVFLQVGHSSQAHIAR